MSLVGIGACGDTKYQNFDSFFQDRKNLEQEKILVNLSDSMSKFIFLGLKASFTSPFPKRLICILSVYLYNLGEFARQIKRHN